MASEKEKPNLVGFPSFMGLTLFRWKTFILFIKVSTSGNSHFYSKSKRRRSRCIR